MAISVKDIQEKVFPTQAAGGYSMEQVDDFLDEIAGQLAALIRENMALNARVAEMDKEMESLKNRKPEYNEAGYFKNLESAMRESLIGAQRLADETTASARAESESMLQKAADEAAKVRADAKAEADALMEHANAAAAQAKAECDQLKASIDAYRANCRKLIEEQLQTLKANDLLFK